MIGPRWRKVFADLWSNKVRTLLVILSIAIGTFAVGVIVGFGVVAEQDMNADLKSANPHSAVISSAPFDDDLLRAVRRLPDVAQAEGRSALTARVEGQSGNWYPIHVIGIPPLDEMEIDRVRLVEGSGRLADREILIERTGLSLIPVTVGDAVRVELPDGKMRELRVAGVVHDVTAFSALFAGQVRAFATPDTIEWLGGSRDYDQLVFTVSESRDDEAHIRVVAQSVADQIEDSERETFQISVSRGKHPMDAVLQGLLVVQGSMAAFLIFVSTFLVVNTITALLGQHVRQIGVMKAIGAHTPQIVGMYIALVLGFGVVAFLVAVPLSTAAVQGSMGLAAEMMNFTAGAPRLPAGVLLLQAVVALGVPVLAALVPVLGGARITVRKAIGGYGLSTGQFGRGLVDRMLEGIRTLPRPTLMSLRNTFRRKGRLALTLSMLSLGGATFIAVFNLRASFTLTLNEMLGYFISDVNVTLARPYRVQKIEQIMASVPGVEQVESWTVVPAQVLSEDKTGGVDVVIYAPPVGSTLIQPALTSGRWLLPEDENAIVVCNQLTRRRPDVQVGDEIVLEMRGQEHAWRVVGICKMAGDVEPGFAYANYQHLAQALGEVGRASDFRAVVSTSSVDTEIADALEAKFKEAGISVSNVTTGSEQREQQALGVSIFLSFLLLLAGLIALVGGLGLMGTMSMNVLERTREIGVMRAIGASNGDIAQLVIGEGLMIGAFSWLLGTLLAIPISKLLSDAVGMQFLTVPLTYVFSLDGFLVWLGAVLVLSALASLWPARNASRLMIRQVLTYE
jgi:putative ABC transport system permease protein